MSSSRAPHAAAQTHAKKAAPITIGAVVDLTKNMAPFDAPALLAAQLEIMKVTIQATAQITASMVTVTNEKNPAKISEAFKVIYKAIQEVVKGN